MYGGFKSAFSIGNIVAGRGNLPSQPLRRQGQRSSCPVLISCLYLSTRALPVENVRQSLDQGACRCLTRFDLLRAEL